MARFGAEMREIPIKLKISPQANGLLRRIAERGIWGTTPEQVAARLLDGALIEKFVEPMRYGVAIEPRREGK